MGKMAPNATTAAQVFMVNSVYPLSAPFFGFMGIFVSLTFANLGSAYGTAKAGVGIASMGQFKPKLVMRNIIPVIMAGIIGIYGLIVSVIIGSAISGKQPTWNAATNKGYNTYAAFDGFAHLGAGLVVGISGLAAGMAIGIVGDAGTRAIGQQPGLFVPNLLILIFAEALALYGLIVALSLHNPVYHFKSTLWQFDYPEKKV